MRRRLLLLASLSLVLAGCATGEPTPIDVPQTLGVSSPTIQPDSPIPQQHTCDGADRSPALTVSDLPSDARTVALVVDDPDAPGGTFVHWVVWNVRVEGGTAQIPEGSVPQDAREGQNDAGGTGYTGPCPPSEDGAHRYRFTAYALDRTIQLEQSATKADLLTAIEPHALAKGTLSASYDR